MTRGIVKHELLVASYKLHLLTFRTLEPYRFKGTVLELSHVMSY